MINVHNLVKLDKYTNIIPLPRLILMTRSFERIGVIPNYTAWRCSLRGNDLDEISFEVTKYVNGVLNPIWDDLIDLKIVSLEHGGKFEIQVTYTDESKTTKSVNGVSLETELGQVALYDFHVNDDFAIEAEGYSPTVLYKPNDAAHSLLHRVLADKAPSWTINENKMTDYVVSDEEGEPEPVNRFQRTYTVDGTTIYDFLTGEVAKDANVVFRFDTDTRQLWCESLVNYVNEQGVEVVDAVGEDTTILVSKKKLGNEITINSNKDSVKNCFRIEGGDDLLTSQVAVVNMTGTNYIYHFADFQLNDMPTALKNAILAYEEWTGSDELQEEYYGEDGLYTRFVEANEQLYYLKDSMAPSIHVDPPATAEIQWGLLKNKLEANDMYIGVSDLTSYDSQYYVGVTNNVKTMLEVWCDSRYKVDLVDDYTPTYNASTHTWTGVFRVTKFSDTNEHYPPVKDNPAQYEPFVFTAKIAEDSDTDLTYTRQKVEIALAKGEMSRVDAEFNNQTTYEEMVEYFEQWNLVKLQSFQVGYQTCQSVLMSGNTLKGGTAPEREIAEQLYAVYTERLKAVNEVLETRQKEVDDQQAIVNQLIGYTDEKGNPIKGEVQQFQENLAFDKYLKDTYGQTEGERLYKFYRSYIREDTYQNSNYTSDDLETQEKLTANAKKLLHQAERELKNSCVLQRTMTVNLNNLLALPEFEPLYTKFELFNYIRVRTDDEVLKLRLIGIDYSGDSMESIEVTFSDQIESVDGNISDLQSVLDQARSIATSYSSTQFKAEQGASARNYVAEIIDNGLNAANTMLKNSEDNEIEITRAGILAKRMDDQGLYGDKQLRIIGNGMYMTEDAWNSVSMAVGEIQFTDPISQETSWKYGVIADAIVGRMIVGQNLYVGNQSGSVEIDGNGIKITNGYLNVSNNNSGIIIDPNNVSDTGYIFAGVKKTGQDAGVKFGMDSNGNAVFNGNITATSLTIVPNADIDGMKVISSVAYAYANSDTNVQPPDNQFGPTMNPQKGKYLWTRTTTSYQGGHYPDDKVYTCAYVGNDGITTVQHELHIDAAAIKKDVSGNYNPSSITLSATSVAGTGTPSAYSGRFKIETSDGSSWTTRYTSSSDESSKSYTIPANIKTIKCSLYASGGITTLLDQQSIPVVIDGADGDDAYTVILTNESHTFSGTTSAAVASSTSTAVVGYKGATQIATTIGTITGTPTGMTTQINNNGTTNASITITVTTSMTTANGTLTVPVTVDGKTFSMIFSYAIAFTGAKGDKGDKGDDGDTGDSIVATRIVYAVSNSSTVAPSASSFSPARPSSITSSQFVWTRTDFIKSDAPSTWITTNTPVYDPIVTAECKSALVVTTSSTGVNIHPLNNSTDYMQLTDTSLDFVIDSTTKAHFGSTGDPRIWIGGTSASPVFSVDSSGNGLFSGKITANDGSIGGWEIGQDSLFYVYTNSQNTRERKIILSPVDTNKPIFLSNVDGRPNGTTTQTWLNNNGIYFQKENTLYTYTYLLESSINIKSEVSSSIVHATMSYNANMASISGYNGVEYGHEFYGGNDNLILYLAYENISEQLQGNVARFNTTFEVESEAGFKYVYDLYSPTRAVLSTVYIIDETVEDNAAFVSGNNGNMDLGTTGHLWDTLYAWSGPIHPSDRNLKNSILPIDDSYEKMFNQLTPVSYKYNRGERKHIGFISQDVEEALDASNLTAMDFAGFCKDFKYAETTDENHKREKIQVFDEDGNPEYQYSLRYEEFIALNTHMIQKLYKRVEELESELAKLK